MCRAASASPPLTQATSFLDYLDTPLSNLLDYQDTFLPEKREAEHEAIAIRGERIVQVGSNAEVLAGKGPRTQTVDLAGKMAIPGLIDCHTHPLESSLVEFDHPIPQMDSVPDVLDYFAARAKVAPEGQWLVLRQVFITRLREQRYPTRAELDAAAPGHPVVFATGPDAMLNTRALELNGIDRNFTVPGGGPGRVEKDPNTGEPTGLIRTFARFVKVPAVGRQPTLEEQQRCLAELFRDYNAVGITAVCERDAYPEQIPVYQAYRQSGGATMRVALSHHLDSEGDLETVRENVRRIARHPLFKKRDLMLRIIGIKTYLDGGMLTGSAYMRQPWGVSAMYGITDPGYRGVRFIPEERLRDMVRATAEAGLQFTAHSVGDGAVHALLEAYEEVGKDLPLRRTRPCVSHANFMSREAIDQAARLGVMLDIQPAWLYLDTRTLVKQFGYERLRYFQPLRSIFEAGVIAGEAPTTCRSWVRCARTILTTPSSEWPRRSRARRAGTRAGSIPRRPSRANRPSAFIRSIAPRSYSWTMMQARSNPANWRTWLSWTGIC